MLNFEVCTVLYQIHSVDLTRIHGIVPTWLCAWYASAVMPEPERCGPVMSPRMEF